MVLLLNMKIILLFFMVVKISYICNVLPIFKLDVFILPLCALFLNKVDRKRKELWTKRGFGGSGSSLTPAFLLFLGAHFKLPAYLGKKLLLEHFNLEGENHAVLIDQLNLISVVQVQEHERPTCWVEGGSKKAKGPNLALPARPDDLKNDLAWMAEKM